jgi:probable F420-dependent oxidoreductase
VAIEVGIELPQVRPGAPATREEVTSFAAAAEAAGFAAAWVMEPHFGTAQGLDPLVTLSFAAASTSTIRLGVSVLVLPTHQPVRLARAAASLDRLSDGRLILGVGVGPAGIPYEAFGARVEERAARTEEYVTAMRELWTAERARFSGHFVRFDGVPFEPKPLQRPLPVWFGGAASRAVRLGDGWMGAGSSTSAQFAAVVRELDGLLERENRDPESFPVAKRVYVAVDQSEEVVRSWLAGIYGRHAPGLDVVTRGTANEIADQLAGPDFGRAGHLLLAPVGDERQVEALAGRVLPALCG